MIWLTASKPSEVYQKGSKIPLWWWRNSLNCPTGAIHLGLLITSCDCNITQSVHHVRVIVSGAYGTRRLVTMWKKIANSNIILPLAHEYVPDYLLDAHTTSCHISTIMSSHTRNSWSLRPEASLFPNSAQLRVSALYKMCNVTNGII